VAWGLSRNRVHETYFCKKSTVVDQSFILFILFFQKLNNSLEGVEGGMGFIFSFIVIYNLCVFFLTLKREGGHGIFFFNLKKINKFF
jgi:hypothetical protein